MMFSKNSNETYPYTQKFVYENDAGRRKRLLQEYFNDATPPGTKVRVLDLQPLNEDDTGYLDYMHYVGQVGTVKVVAVPLMRLVMDNGKDFDVNITTDKWEIA